MTFYRCAFGTIGFFLRLYYKVEVIDAGKIPQDNGFILCANHSSNLDPLLLGAMLKREIRFMAKAELFKIPVLKNMLKWAGIFGVQRGKGDTGALDYASKIVNSGEVLGLFPEGTRAKERKMLRAKSGLAVIAASSKADLLPIGISYVGKGFRTKVFIKIGDLIKNEELDISEPIPSKLKQVGKLIMEKISSLLVEGHQYDANS